ncbi:MAG: hypothetical protein ACTSPV_14015 [Candidatus Hodarchaeales archaeon]
MIAIIISATPSFIRYLRRPKINLEPALGHAPIGNRIVYAIMITNIGEETAKNIILDMECIEPKKEILPISPTTLCTIEKLHNCVSKGHNILTADFNDNKIYFNDISDSIEKQDTTIQFIISGDNISTFRQSFKYVDSDDLIKTDFIKI